EQIGKRESRKSPRRREAQKGLLPVQKTEERHHREQQQDRRDRFPVEVPPQAVPEDDDGRVEQHQREREGAYAERLTEKARYVEPDRAHGPPDVGAGLGAVEDEAQGREKSDCEE